MRQIILTSLAFMFLVSLLFADEAKAQMKQAKNEAEKMAKEANKKLLHQFDDLGFSKDDLLPGPEKGMAFDPKDAKENLKNPKLDKSSDELKEILKIASQRDKLEGTEDVFFQGHVVVENPQKSLDITATHIQEIPEEEKLEICQEAGTYQVSFIQTRRVKVSPEIKNQFKSCLGHREEKEFFWKKDADRKAERKEKEFSKDITLESYDVYIDKGGVLKDYRVVIKWKHKDNALNCDNYSTKEIVVRASSEEDYWETDFPEGLSMIETNPNCKLLYPKILEGPETRVISGKPIFRDRWSQQLFFSCEPNIESKCSSLRNAGGVLVGKKCLKENIFAECDLWEKTYDLGKKAAYRKVSAEFKNTHNFYGFDGDFDSSYDKNTELGPILTTLSIFADMKKSLEDSDTDFKEKDVEVFKGEDLKCKHSFLGGQIFDCCKKMEGVAVKASLAKCNSEEQNLAEKRSEDKCHYVGSQKALLGSETTQVFCCFPTKLARILQEEGRVQLKIEWGEAGHPKCRGLTIHELQTIDFSKIDLSEAVEDLKIDKAEMLRKIQSTIQSTQAKDPTQFKLGTETIIQSQLHEIQK